VWVFADGPSFPGPRYMRIVVKDGRAQGAITTDWYGDLPMNKLRIDGDVAHFEIDNGNAKLPPLPWTATLRDGQARAVAFSAADAGLAAMPAHIRDVWAQRELPASTWRAAVPAHGVVLLVLHPGRD
jgi:predicted GNAT superfamily acetyltransferase